MASNEQTQIQPQQQTKGGPRNKCKTCSAAIKTGEFFVNCSLCQSIHHRECVAAQLHKNVLTCQPCELRNSKKSTMTASGAGLTVGAIPPFRGSTVDPNEPSGSLGVVDTSQTGGANVISPEEYAKIQDDLQKALRQAAESEKKAKEASERLANEKKNFDEQIKVRENENSGLRSELDESRKNESDSANRETEAQNQLAILSEKDRNMQEMIEVLRAQIVDLENIKVAHEGALKESCELYEECVEQLKRQEAESQDTVSQLQSTNEKLSHENDELNRKNEDLIRELDAIKSNRNSRESTVVQQPLTSSLNVNAENFNPIEIHYLERIRRASQTLTRIDVSSARVTPSQTPQTAPVNVNRQTSVDSRASLTSASSASGVELLLRRQLISDLPAFDGKNAREWVAFEQEYFNQIKNGQFSESEMEERLRKAIKPPARDLVDDMFYSSSGSAIMDVLRCKYGKPEQQLALLLKQVDKLPELSGNGDKRISEISKFLNNYCSQLKQMNMHSDLKNTALEFTILSKMARANYLYRKWLNEKAKLRDVTLEHFAAFVREEYINMPSSAFEPEKTREVKRPEGFHQVLSHVQVQQRQSSQPSSYQSSSNLYCEYCKGSNHRIYHCRSFKALSITDRNNAVKEKRLCFSCLKSDHQYQNCPSKRECGLDQCNSFHSRYLHERKNQNISYINNSNKENNQPEQSTEPPPQENVVVSNSHMTVLTPLNFHMSLSKLAKIGPARIYGRNEKFVDTFAYYDDGSFCTIMERQLAIDLNLPGEMTMLKLQWTKKITRTEEAFKCSLEISGQQMSERYRFDDVYAVDDLSLPIQTQDGEQLAARYEHLKGLEIPSFTDAKPRILIGLDQARFLNGNPICGPTSNEPVATQTKLGWLVYGKTEVGGATSCMSAIHIPVLTHEAEIIESDDETSEVDDVENSRKLNGPVFLETPSEQCPINQSNCVAVNTHVIKSNDPLDMMKLKFRANWTSIVRTVAYMRRFLRMKVKKKHRPEQQKFISAEEFNRAELSVLHKIQKDAFKEELDDLMNWKNLPEERKSSMNRVSRSSSISEFLPFLDENNVIRMSSRNQKASSSYAAQNPVILPNRHEFVTSFIRYHHERNHHFGTEAIVANIRETAWIIAIRQAVLRVNSNCVWCKKMLSRCALFDIRADEVTLP